MKTIIAALMLLPLSLHAETLSKEISRDVVSINVAVHRSSVRCSSLGYGRPELKVDVPDLDSAATFNHRQLGEGQPCMTAGVCGGSHTPDHVLAAGEGDVATNLTVVHKEVATIDTAHGTCTRELVEEVAMHLRGFTFTHERTAPLSPVSATECRKLYK